MKIIHLLAVFFVFACTNAHAEWFLRGTQNGWGNTQMVTGGTNTMQLTNVVFTSAGSIKFDRFGDWKENYGVGGKNGTNISVAAGTWNIKFFTDTKNWSVTPVLVSSSSKSILSSSSSKLSSSVKSSSSAVSSFSASSTVSSTKYHLRGTHNGWKEGDLFTNVVGSTTDMSICRNFLPATGGARFKVDPNGGWGSDAFPATDMPASGWTKIVINRSTKAIKNVSTKLTENCGAVVSSSSSSVKNSSSSSSIKNSSQSSLSSSIVSSSSIIPVDFSLPANIVLDAAHNRALVVDIDLSAVIAVDLVNGIRSMVSSEIIPNAANSFNLPTGIALDSARNRALVVSNNDQAIISVDLITGGRTVLSNNNTPNALNSFSEPWGIVLDSARNRALVLDIASNSLAVIAVDLSTGARTILSSNSVPNTTNKFNRPTGIAIDAVHNRVLVTEGDLNIVVAVNLTTGARTLLSSAPSDFELNQAFPIGIVIDAVRNRALVADLVLQAVIAVDLTTGARSILSNNSIPNANNKFSFPEALTLDADRNRVLVVDTDLQSVIAVDLTTGERTILSQNSSENVSSVSSSSVAVSAAELSSQGLFSVSNSSIKVRASSSTSSSRASSMSIPSAVFEISSGASSSFTFSSSASSIASSVATNVNFVRPVSIALDLQNRRVLVLDGDLKAVIAVSLDDGARTVFSDLNGFNILTGNAAAPATITLDSAHNRALVVDFNLQAIIAVDLSNGSRSILSDSSIPNESNQLFAPDGIALDIANNRALVTDWSRLSVVAVDLTSGARTVVGSAPFNPTDIAIDVAHNRALVLSNGGNFVTAVDLTTGVSTVFANFNSAFGFVSPASITIDAANNRALIVGVGFGEVITVDLSNASIGIIPGGKFIKLRMPEGIALDEVNNRVFLLDPELQAVITEELSSGERAVLTSNNPIPIDSSFSFSFSSSLSSASASSASSSSSAQTVYHLRGTQTTPIFIEGDVFSPVVGSSTDFEICRNFMPTSFGEPRFKVDPNGGWSGDDFPEFDVAASGWTRVVINGVTRTIVSLTTNMAANCGVMSGSSSSSNNIF